MRTPMLVITMGDPSGIGPEIIAASLADAEIRAICNPLVIGDRGAMEAGIAAAKVNLALTVTETLPDEPDSGVMYLKQLKDVPPQSGIFGNPTASGAEAAYQAVREAATLCIRGEVEGMVTAPLSKDGLKMAGHRYPGHTELLAEMTGTSDYVMMLAGDRLRVALVTIHEPISLVPQLLTREKILGTIRVTHADVGRYFRCNPKIAVLALNPHAGENGLFGDEEARIITPAVAAARREGIDAVGPLSADSLFHFAVRGDFDAVVAMYHDQGLIPLKLVHFEDGVNITLGLPIIRTSVDHGTAFAIAGKGVASPGSMKAAIRTAAAMARKRREANA